MKIGTRLCIALAIPIAILISGFAILEDGANRMRSRAEVTREGHMIARSVQLATVNALRDRQLSDVHSLIDDISGHESVLGIRLFDATGRLSYAPAAADAAPLPAAGEVLRSIRLGGLVEEHLRVGGRPVVAWLAPLHGPEGATLGAVQVLQLESFVEEDARASSRAIAVLAAILIGAVWLTVYVVSQMSVARPIEDLVVSVRGIGDGDWHARVPVRRRDELGRLAREFNGMCQRLELAQTRLREEQEERRRIEADLRGAERLASLGRFAAGVAHEIGTPLNVIGGRAEALIRRGSADPVTERGLRIIAGQIERITRIVRSMLEFARARELKIAPTDLRDVLARLTELVEERFEAQGIRLELSVPSELPPLAADADQLQQVFLNLALNAADAMPSGGRLQVQAGLGARQHPEHGPTPRSCVAVTFADSGCGIPPGVLDHVFEPFFTTKEVGAGTGLGLAIAYGIVREHGGWIEVASAPGLGTRITVCLPQEPRVTHAQSAGAEAAA